MANPIRVALLDSGINAEVSALSGFVKDAYFIDSGAQLKRQNTLNNDKYGHGTRMAGVLLQVTPEVEIVDVCILDEQNTCSLNTLAVAIELASTLDVRIISLALSCLVDHAQVVADAVAKALARGKLIVASSRNGPTSLKSIPAELDGVLGVKHAPLKSILEWTFDVDAPIQVGAYGAPVKTWSRAGKQVDVWGNSSAATLVTGICCRFLLEEPSASINSVFEYLANHQLSRVDTSFPVIVTSARRL